MVCFRLLPCRARRSASARTFSILRRVSRSLLLLPVVALIAPPPSFAAPPSDTKQTKPAIKPGPVLTEDNEVKIGRENAEENDKHVKLVTDAAMVERVNRIGQEIATVANKNPVPAHWGSSQLKQFTYTFKIVDDKDVNAYSLPGGFIYINKGLIDYVHSDDELAGVLAHEIGHDVHHHMVKLMHEQNKIQNILLPLLAVVLIAGHPSAQDAEGIVLTSQLFTIAKMSSYGVDAEKDADHTAILLLTHTHFNPAGLYSVMLRMAADERSHTYFDLGIFRTHPPSAERADAAKELLDTLHIAIHLSEVDPNLKARVVPAKGSSGTMDMAEIMLHGVVLCRLAAADNLTAEERGQRVAKRLNGMLDMPFQSFEVRVNPEKTRVLLRGFPVLTEADAAAQSKTLTDLAHDMANAIMTMNQKQQIDSGP